MDGLIHRDVQVFRGFGAQTLGEQAAGEANPPMNVTRTQPQGVSTDGDGVSLHAQAPVGTEESVPLHQRSAVKALALEALGKASSGTEIVGRFAQARPLCQ